MINKEIGLTTLQLIQSTLPTQSEFDEDEEFSYDRLLQWLTHQVAFLIDHDFQRLIEALYRIDLPESTVAKTLSGDLANISNDLAKAILERQLQKAETRLKYKDW